MSEHKLVKLEGQLVSPHDKAEMVKMLEEALVETKAGKIRSCHISGYYTDGCHFCQSEGDYRPADLATHYFILAVDAITERET